MLLRHTPCHRLVPPSQHPLATPEGLLSPSQTSHVLPCLYLFDRQPKVQPPSPPAALAPEPEGGAPMKTLCKPLGGEGKVLLFQPDTFRAEYSFWVFHKMALAHHPPFPLVRNICFPTCCHIYGSKSPPPPPPPEVGAIIATFQARTLRPREM